MTVNIFITFVAAYLLGSVPFALLLGKLKGVDIRRIGSGNVGATNLTRVLGGKWGKTCFLLDFGKGAVPTGVVLIFVDGALPGGAWLPVAAAAGAVIGHVWPIWLGFNGGKGVATTLGAIFVLSPWAFLAGGVVWLLLFHISRYVSLASIGAAAVLPMAHFTAVNWRQPDYEGGTEIQILILLTVLSLFIIWRHRGNIQRLLKGTEHKFSRKGKEKPCE